MLKPSHIPPGDEGQPPEALSKLGADIRNARRRHRIQAQTMADDAGISRPTLRRLERGDPTVSAGAYAAVLGILGLAGRLADVADASADRVGLAFDTERLPERVSSSAARRLRR